MPDQPPWPTEPFDALDSDAPRPGPARGGVRRGVVTAAVVVLALVAAGLVGGALARGGGTAGDQAALAAAASSSTTGPDSARDKLKAWRNGPGMMHGRGHLLGAGGALHGTFVVPDGSGGYRTLVMQRGKATQVSDTSITVRSEDGFQQTYAVTDSTVVGADRQGVAGIAKNADIAVMGEQKGSTVSALHVADLSALDALRRGGPGGFGGMGGMMGGPDDDDAPATGGTGSTAYGA